MVVQNLPTVHKGKGPTAESPPQAKSNLISYVTDFGGRGACRPEVNVRSSSITLHLTLRNSLACLR